MSSKENIVLSVIIPAFNRAAYLPAAIASVFAEDISGVEVLVSDDGSTDNTQALLRELSDKLPVRNVRWPQRTNPAAARNRALAEARGSFLTFLDSDDEMTRGGLRWRLAWLQADAQRPVVAGNFAEVMNAAGQSLGTYDDVVIRHRFPFPALLTSAYLRGGGHFLCQLGLLMLRRSLLEEVGRFDETLRIGEDLDFFFRLAEQAPIPCFDRPVFRYRLHDSQISGRLTERGFEYNALARAEGALVRWGHERKAPSR